jgi:PAS domain S-box-containing protein
MNNNNGVNEISENSPVLHHDKAFESVDIFKTALDSANVGIWIIDVVSRKFLPSGRTRELFGFLPEKEMSVDEAMMQVKEKYRKVVLEVIENAFKKHDNFHIECPVIDFQQNTERWLGITGGYSNSDVNNSYFSGIVMDITDQKQNDLRRSKFIGMVSHELKTPLTVIKAYVQILNNWAKKQKDNFAVNALSKVERQVKKMLNMINSLLNLSGAEVGKIPINKQEFDLDKLIHDVVEEMQFMTTTHTIHIVPCPGLMVNADREKIEQVLVNLIGNAAKYSGKDTAIEIGCDIKQDFVELWISDQGMGIAQADIDKLFLPHYRVESKETRKITGFGIGLYLCAEIIKRHDGAIRAESEPGQGSTFKFTLPLK